MCLFIVVVVTVVVVVVVTVLYLFCFTVLYAWDRVEHGTRFTIS